MGSVHLLTTPERLEDGTPGKLVGPVAEHRPVRHLARRCAAGPDRVEDTVRSRRAQPVEVRRARSLETAQAPERLMGAVGQSIEEQDDDRVHSGRYSLQGADHPYDACGNERFPLATRAESVAHVRSGNLLLGALVEDDDLVPGLAHALELRATPFGEQPEVL